MKSIFTLIRTVKFATIAFSILLNIVVIRKAEAQCNTVVWGLTGDGAIYPITVATATTGSAIRSTSYTGNGVQKANAIAYQSSTGRYYYFKRNVGNSPQEFVYYDPLLHSTVIRTTSSPFTGEVHTGAMNLLGTGYWAIDVNARLCYYNALLNTWTFITATFKDQFNNNVTTTIQDQSAGDIAFDAQGNLWIVTSSDDNWGLYRLPSNINITTAKASITLTRIIAPTRTTPNHNSIAGIAFNSNGQIYMSTRNDDRLYRLNDNLTTTLMGTMGVDDLGNDLTSCAYPINPLPVKWVSFDASLLQNNQVKLNWSAVEENVLGYFVQHSKDGSTWTDLSYTERNDSYGGTQSYSYKHFTPSAGNNYYRVKMVDASKNESYTEVRMISLKPGMMDATVSVWPNPASDQVKINSTAAGNMKIRIVDLSGKVQVDKQLQAGETTLNIASLQKGTYILNISFANGESSNQKLIKQ